MSHFFAYLARMKYIQRWGLMRNALFENIQEHSLQVAMVAHGLACAVMLPVAMRTNRSICERDLAALAQPLTGQTLTNTAKAADASIDAIEALCRDVGIPQKLSEIGVTANQIDALVVSSRGNSMNGNPRTLSDAELRDILGAML